MRPNADVPDSNQYECLDCGNRVTDPADRACEHCEGSLRYLGLSRDL